MTRDDWHGHMNGATALLKTRGVGPHLTAAGSQLCMEWRGQLVRILIIYLWPL